MMNDKTLPVVLTIAGSDCSGGAGIQADLKTMMAFGVYGASVITAVTVQNTCGVSRVEAVAPEVIAQQIDAVCSDLCPQAVKIGMLPDEQAVLAVAETLKKYDIKHLVIDPVMVSTSRKALMQPEAQQVFTECLLPMASVVTPNIPEAEALTGMKLRGKDGRIAAAKQLNRMYKAHILIKGGHAEEDADDLLYLEKSCVKQSGNVLPGVVADGEKAFVWFPGGRIETTNSHGTGCTLSSAIASCLAKGEAIVAAVGEAKAYLRGALQSGLNLGAGNGPVDHGWRQTL